MAVLILIRTAVPSGKADQIDLATVLADIADSYTDASVRARFRYLRISYERNSWRCASFFVHEIRLPFGCPGAIKIALDC
jgi:hypothetical protein